LIRRAVPPLVLRKDLLRVSRAGGGYHPQFAGRSHRPLAARTIGVFQGHVGEPRHRLDDALEDLEADAEDFKLVRGFAALLERDATFETHAPLPPERVRRTVFEAAESVGGVVDDDGRMTALTAAADRLGADADAVETSLYADRDVNEVLSAFDPRWDPDELIEQYNLSLAQTALFDATEVRIRSSDPKRLVSAVKRLGLLYEIERRDDDDREREVVVTGPDALFRRTRRYGTAFARLLRSVAESAEWSLSATIDDRGTDRELRLRPEDVSVPGVEPIAEPTYDSGVEADFAARFGNLDLDWELSREPEPLAAGARAMIPDFAFDYRPGGDSTTNDGEDTGAPALRVFFEVMGFWTPEYVEKKLDQFGSVDDDIELLVAVDESLGVGEEIEALDHRVVTYTGRVRVKDVVDALREYEADLVDAAAASLPAELVPDADVIGLDSLAADRGVGVDALDAVAFPEHERVGRTLIRPAVLDAVGAELEAGMSLSDAETVLDEYGIDDASATLSRLGYRVEWEGLGGGTLRES
jgi:predicted nuclease of restriction endonuclease-like RecB superfamily